MASSDFLEKVRKSLDGVTGMIGIGVSGGADSVALLLSLVEIFGGVGRSRCELTEFASQTSQGEFTSKIIAVTVNHHIRTESETNGDVEFVKSLAGKYPNVRLVVCDLEKGQVQQEAEKRKCGIEEAARFLRYECFEKVIAENHIDYFCLAHNQNDNLETILMRFLQGSQSGGIPETRGKYIRPLINITRTEIEEFLKSAGQDWRTDSTNFDDAYLRNNIRLNLIPILDEKFPGWKNALLAGAEKSKIDNDFILDEVEKIYNPNSNLNRQSGGASPNGVPLNEISLSPELFTHDAISMRILIRATNDVGVMERVPYQFLKDVIFEIKKSISKNRSFSKRFSDVEIGFENKNVFVKKYQKKQTDSGFFDIIEKEGRYNFPFGALDISKSENGFVTLTANEKSVTYEVDFPFVVRSPCIGEKKQLFVVEW